jgi:hypothetical protein
MKQPFTRRRRNALVYGLLGLVLLAVLVQLWLLWATVDAYRLGDESTYLPKALFSLLCLVLNLGLLAGVWMVERMPAT